MCANARVRAARGDGRHVVACHGHHPAHLRGGEAVVGQRCLERAPVDVCARAPSRLPLCSAPNATAVSAHACARGVCRQGVPVSMDLNHRPQLGSLAELWVTGALRTSLRAACVLASVLSATCRLCRPFLRGLLACFVIMCMRACA